LHNAVVAPPDRAPAHPFRELARTVVTGGRPFDKSLFNARVCFMDLQSENKTTLVTGSPKAAIPTAWTNSCIK
jgi:hypothetical protein